MLDLSCDLEEEEYSELSSGYSSHCAQVLGKVKEKLVDATALSEGRDHVLKTRGTAT